jgi:hypothetical protein
LNRGAAGAAGGCASAADARTSATDNTMSRRIMCEASSRNAGKMAGE